MNFSEQAAENLRRIQENKPLIHNITNFVVMNYTANVLLAAGASPVMAHAENEVEEMVGFAGALVLNIGTLSDAWLASMITAGKEATRRGTPIVLDPVGSGATRLRTDAAKAILAQTRVRIVRGNASEILSLGDADAQTKGVDSAHGVDQAAAGAADLARSLDTTLAITGPIDLVTDGRRIIRVANGHPLMPFVTGTGCSASTLVGAFAAVDDDPVSAAATALAFFGLAGEKAGAASSGPGSFMIALLDALYLISPDELEAGCRISDES
ncbi:hydroxyethylthiazole kinase [Desulfofustis glycolicus]|uniref:Hydroxyethylthiazole kinase n=1 Tax=Desulfofustis glycolicus DSM 9705 TaxID=1121409 RepID=A0A1M5XEG3_9BACT|nr:hydroxyethylthiazole kinase [Desulfofustis glycolicus]MCB2218543.1 hydroxyethylthiazole kinase [Desulfobulbaceae bacterium]SHH98220.1 hydroxyethylthiazole kinase [Desulfofustis glycolicus DSM 9705]